MYCLQEHSSIVDVFDVVKGSGDNRQGVELIHRQGIRIIPQGLDVSEFWADEVRASLTGDGTQPKYLYASTRGLKEGRKGYIAVYALDGDGYVSGAETIANDSQTNGEPRDDDQGGLLAMYETATSGGWANAIQPGPTVDGVEYIAMTDSEVGFVFVFGWDGREIKEVARVHLNEGSELQGKARDGAATTVWF